MSALNKIRLRYQVLYTFVILFTIYLFFAGIDVQELDLINELLFILFQPVVGILVCLTTIIACIIIGLPIRLIQKFNVWWVERSALQLAVLGLGSLLLILSVSSGFVTPDSLDVNDEQVMKQEPNYYLAISGWFITAFSILHLYPSGVIMNIKNILNRHK